MTLPCSGQISLLDVRSELGRTGQISMNDADVRALASKPSGQIAMSDFHCKSTSGWANVTNPMTVSYNPDHLWFADIVGVVATMTVKSATKWGLATPEFANICDGNNGTGYASPYTTFIANTAIGRTFYATGNLKLNNVRVRYAANYAAGSEHARAVDCFATTGFDINQDLGLAQPGYDASLSGVVRAGGQKFLRGPEKGNTTIDTIFNINSGTLATAGQTRAIIIWLQVFVDYNNSGDFYSKPIYYEFDFDVEGGIPLD